MTGTPRTHGRGRDQRPARYEPLGWALLRAPLLPADARPSARSALSDSSSFPPDPLLDLAIRVASPDLAAAWERTGPLDRPAPRLAHKLRRYAIRMSTRPTPFGLFAGVGLARWAPATDVAITPAESRTHSRADMGWVHDVAEALRSDPDIGPRLRLRAAPGILVRSGRAFLPDGGPGAGTSVRATSAVRSVLTMARRATARADLREAVGGIPGATPDRADRLVDGLTEQGFLIPESSPAPTGGDPVTRLRTTLEAAGSRRALAVADELARLLEEFARWDELPLDRKGKHLPSLLDRMGEMAEILPDAKGTDRADGTDRGNGTGSGSGPAPGSAKRLQTDTALSLTATGVHASVGTEAAAAADLLLRLSRPSDGALRMEEYGRAFEGRYGTHGQVPLLELLDPSVGLGPPSGHGASTGGANGQDSREHVLLNLALEANRERRTAVELDDELLARLAPSDTDTEPDRLPPSLDLSFLLAAGSAEAIDRGEFQLVVGPTLGASAAGRTLGRFAGLLGPPAHAALEELARIEQTFEPGRLLAEVIYAPDPPRSANVALTPPIRRHEIVVDTWPGVPDDAAIPLSELVVGRRAGRFVVSWPSGGAEVVAVQGHMLNTARAPAAVRFLLEVAQEGRCRFAPFSWGPAAGLTYLPRVQRGRTVVALAQWRLDPAEVIGPDRDDAFAAALTRWRVVWEVPRHVYLAVADNRLLLDLDDAQDVELLHEELRAGGAARTVLLQEALPGPEHAWLPGPDGGHMCELVAPLVRRAGEPAASRPSPVVHVVEPEARLRPPGSDWLYLKLYCDPQQEEDLIAGPLSDFGRYAVESGRCAGWFFVRYADPESHVRLRFHGDPALLTGPLMEQACAWAGGLRVDGLCRRFSFETYDREVERYGGEGGMTAAEALFMADSPSVAGMLRAHAEGSLGMDLLELAVISIDDLLAHLGLSAEERAGFSYGGPSVSRLGGTEYRMRKDALRQALGGPRPVGDGAEVSRLLTARGSALVPAVDLITALRLDGGLCRTAEELCQSYVHLHANRLLGTDAPSEALALELLRRTRAGLARAPLASA
ncbi:lantibiotic dehydratase [Streptomyces sp. NPDC048604]|uniref:lantibiotic dehydratase n=1 Tax=Streptomyces sp. NPDC048604 TaxID=3365578 RepID=UPI003714244E